MGGTPTLPSALVNQAVVELLGAGSFRNDEHPGQFYALAARVMRHVLIDYEREHHALKRGGAWGRSPQEAACGVEDSPPSISQIETVESC